MTGNAVVMGLGMTGASAVRFLSARGYRVCAMDTRPTPPHAAAVQRDCPGVELIIGGWCERRLEEAALVVVSPGIAADAPPLARARQRGADVLGDVALFARYARAPIAAITGTNGKSTVTALLGHVLASAGRDVAVGGNIGTPALDLLDRPPADGYVLELSSFQLDLAGSLPLRCASVLNVSPDHLDRYPDFETYVASKRRIYAAAEVAVCNAEDPATLPPAGFEGRVIRVGTAPPAEEASWGIEADAGPDGRRWLCGPLGRLAAVDSLPVAGRHNEFDVLVAWAMADAWGVELAAIRDAVLTFEPLPHRCTPVGEVGGVRFVDDSKATNVGACRAAVEGLDLGQRDLVVILGGDGKGADFTGLREPFRQAVRAAVVIGADAPAIVRALEGVCTAERAHSMEEAVGRAFALAAGRGRVLLAPACASFDMFESYAHRGRAFGESVRALAARTECPAGGAS